MARRAQASDHFLEWPTDRSLDLLQRLLLELILMASARRELQFAWFWPDKHPWAAVLTHDVETGAGLARVQVVADMERQRALRSSFNLVPLDYEIPDSMLENLRDGRLSKWVSTASLTMGSSSPAGGRSRGVCPASTSSAVRGKPLVSDRRPPIATTNGSTCLNSSTTHRFRTLLGSSRSRGAARRSFRFRWAV